MKLYYDMDSISYSPLGYIFVITKSVAKDEDYMVVEILINCAMEEEFKFTFIIQKVNGRWIKIDPDKPGIEEVLFFIHIIL